MSAQQQPIPNNEILQAAFDSISPEERLALETLATINVLKRQAGLAPQKRAASAKPGKAKTKPQRQLRKRRSRRKTVQVASPAQASHRAHESRCNICRHEDRAAIEEAFLHWQSPDDIRYDYGIQRRALYRHAHALGLFSARARNLRFALGNIIERASSTYMPPECILRAVQAFGKINDEGRWTEPPRHLIISRDPGAVVAAVADATGVADLSAASRVRDISPSQPPAQLPAANVVVAPDIESSAPESPALEPPVPESSQTMDSSQPAEAAESSTPVRHKPAFILDRSRFAHW